MEEELKYDEEKTRRKMFLDEIKLTLEAEYNAPLKPKTVGQVDKKMIREKFKKIIDKFQEKNNMTYEEIIQFLLDRIKEDRGISPKSSAEHDFLEEILSDMFGKKRRKNLIKNEKDFTC